MGVDAGGLLDFLWSFADEWLCESGPARVVRRRNRKVTAFPKKAALPINSSSRFLHPAEHAFIICCEYMYKVDCGNS